jgi:glycosyltransferase involved in cell wall biosynthesis
MRQLAEQKLATGFSVASVCYGVEDVCSRDWASVGLSREVFEAYAIDQLDASDLIFCGTKRVVDDLHQLAMRNCRVAPAMRMQPPGADPMLSPQAMQAPVSPLIAQVCSSRFGLAVGPLAADQNYSLLLDVWERLASEPGCDLKLVIVGAEGPSSESIASRIGRSSALRNRVHWFVEVTDRDLLALYSSCAVFTSPGLENHWALALTEALKCGRVAVSSDRLALPENTARRVVVLDPLDVSRWSDEIRRLSTSPSVQIESIVLPNWDDYATRVKEEIQALAVV